MQHMLLELHALQLSQSLCIYSLQLSDLQLKSWSNLSIEYGLPQSHWRTYLVTKEACNVLPFPIKFASDTGLIVFNSE